jgi:hypothetical protein
MKRLLLAAAVTVVFFAAPATASADAPWQCGGPQDPGHCWWGYNHLTPGVNNWVPGPYNWWVTANVFKSNGGTITYGMYSASNGNWCLNNMSGSNQVTFFSPSDVGCGGYNRPALGYFSGNSSYTRMNVQA